MTLNLAGSTGDRQPSRAGSAAGAGRRRRDPHRHSHWIVGFEEITRRARERFERRDWRGSQADATARLALYRIHLDAAVADVRDILEDAVLERTLLGRGQSPARATGSPAGPTPRSPRRSSIRSPGGSSARSAPTPRSSISTPHRPGASVRTSELPGATLGRRGGRRSGPPDPRGLPLVGTLRPARPRRRPRGRRSCASASPRLRRGAGDGRDAPSGLLPEQGRLPRRADRPGRAGLPLVLPLDPRRARHRGGCGADDRERGQHRLRLQLVVLPGGGATARGRWWSSSARSCRSSGSTSCTARSASTSTARPSCTAA